jgi:RHS repeat-associated protein
MHRLCEDMDWHRGYRYGFNRQEKSDEIKGEGNSYTAEFWEYDPRIGRRWNLDPKPFVGISDYATLGNNPIFNVDPKGDMFFRLFGSTSEQRKSARSFQKEHGGEIKNYWKKDMSVKYQTSYKAFDGAFQVNSRNQQFKKDGGLIRRSDGEIREHIPGSMEKWSLALSECEFCVLAA